MPGAPRKPPAKKAAPKKAPAPKVTMPAAEQVERFDLLDILAVDKPPTPITIFGIEADVRSDFTGLEVFQFEKLLGTNKIHDVLIMIIGEDAADQLWEQVEQIRPESTAKILNRILELAGLGTGETIVPLPTSLQGMDGAPALPDSGSATS